MKEVMCDLETLGTGPRSAIVSIGCVLFDSTGLGAEFYVNVSAKSAVQAGMQLDGDTVRWWLQQSEEARAALRPFPQKLSTALRTLSDWMPPGARLWGNGATFDNVILRSAYTLTEITPPWHYRDDRCFRTLKAMNPGVLPDPQVGLVAHNALGDAKRQARHAVKIMNYGSTK